MMQRLAFFLFCAAGLIVAGLIACGPHTAAAQDRRRSAALDIVPADALAAVAIRNVRELTKRGDDFIEKTEFKTPLRLSDGYRFVVDYLGLKAGLDDEGAAALMMFKTDFEEDSLVLAVPVSDWEAMAGNFRLTRKELAEGKVVDRRAREGDGVFNFVRYLAPRRDHLYLGGSEKFVEAAAAGKTLRETLPEGDRASFAQDDILFYANARKDKDEGWVDWLTSHEQVFDRLAPDEAAELRSLLAAAKGDLKYGLGGLRLAPGLGATLVLRFEGEDSREHLERLKRAGKSRATLAALPAALPKGGFLAAHAASGGGEETAALARALVHASLAGLAVETRELVSAGHRPNVAGVFGEIWRQLEGSRAALYENELPERDGAFCLLAVLDTAGSAAFLAEMKSLARFVNAAGLTLEDDAEAIDERTIASLVAQLGHEKYPLRQSATTKLGLVGKPALPALEAAANSPDAEVQFRARALRQQINAALAEERQDLLKRDLLARVRPNFALFADAENRKIAASSGAVHSQAVDIVQLRLRLDEAEQAAALRRLFGPDWNKVRLARVQNQIVLLFGSHIGRFDEAIANVRASAIGLEADARLAPFRELASAERAVEFHFSLARGQELAAPAAAGSEEPAKPAGITSFGLSLSAERVRLDLFSPYEEVKSVVKRWSW